MQKASLILMLPVMLFTACKSEVKTNSTKYQDVAVTTALVENNQTNYALNLSGNIDGDQTVKLGFMVAGKIQRFLAKEGQTVAKGQTIAVLDQQQYKLAVEMADVQVQQVNDEFQRLKLMKDRQSLAEADFKKAEFGLMQAKNQRKQHQINLDYSTITAPINGIILKKLNEENEIVAQGYPVVVIADIRKVKVNVYVPESELQFVKIGQMADVSIAAIDKVVKGKITEVGGMAEATTRAFTVKIELDNPDFKIRPGMIAQVKLNTNVEKNALVIDANAVLKDLDGKTYVYVVDEKQRKAFKRFVTIGEMNGLKLAINSGLEKNERIVIGGQHRLTDGSTVQF